jgi:hypothetical protein
MFHSSKIHFNIFLRVSRQEVLTRLHSVTLTSVSKRTLCYVTSLALCNSVFLLRRLLQHFVLKQLNVFPQTGRPSSAHMKAATSIVFFFQI